MQGQEITVRTGHVTTDWFQTGEGVHQGCILSPCLFNFSADYLMRNVKLDSEKVEEPEITLTTSLDHRKSKRIPEKRLLLLL